MSGGKKKKDAASIINEAASRKAPAFNRGIQQLDIKKFLAEANEHQVRALMGRNFALWAQFSGVKVDGHDFNFETHRYLLPIYMDHGQRVVWMKAAQLGATVYMLLRLLWYARYKQVNAALYFPTGGGVEDLSKARLGPLIASNEELSDNLTDTNTLGLKQIRNVQGTDSSLYMLYMGGKASKDSVPLDILAFDEVRLIDPADIDQVQERIAHSSHKVQIYMSTAGYPDCFSGDTKIVVREKSSGRVLPKPISELVGCYEDFEALSYSRKGGNRPRWRNIIGAVSKGVRDVVDVTFWGGSRVTCTADHRFCRTVNTPTGTAFEWQPVNDFSVYPKHWGGSHHPEGVACVNSIPDVEGNKWGVQWAHTPYDLETIEILGFFIAEGNLHEKAAEFWQLKDNGYLDKVRAWAQRHGLSTTPLDVGVRVSLVRRPDFLELFTRCGTGAPNKQIPSEILRSSTAQLERLMAGMIAGDGHIRNDSDGREFDYYTSSKTLAEQLKFVGLRIGKPLAHNIRPPECHVLSYNPNAHRSAEVLPSLGNLAIRSIESSGQEEVFDLQIEDTPWFVLAENGALVHNCDIHARFLRGTQLTWHTKCNCPDGVILPDVFPDCVVERTKKDGTKETFYRCPKCKYRINDVQNGQYIPHNPGADFNSYSVTQLNSYYISAKDLFDFYKTTTNIREFYNGKLGKPYVDEANRPITDDVFNACVNDNLKWAANLPSRRIKGGCAMGVDQHSGNCVVTIMKRGKEGKKQIAHLEVIESSNPIYWEYDEKIGENAPVTPFKRLHQLMDEFNVQMCVIDAMPNINEAYAFARAFPGRVFIAHYKDAGQDMVLWYDRAKTKEAIRKGSKETRMKHQVLLNRYAVLDYALKQWTDGIMEVPPVGKHIPLVRNEKTGKFEATALALTLKDHLKRLVRQETVLNEETGKSKMEWIYLGGDPHYAHSFSYCNIAIERLRHTALFTFG